jgi:hypothetical protein
MAAASVPATTERQLHAALQAMELLQAFAPRLAGALASGTADPRLPIVLHVRAGHADDVHHLLDEHRIPVRMRQTRMYPPRAPAEPLPGISFLAGDQEFLIWIFTEAQFRQRVRIGDESAASPRMTRAAVERALARLTLAPGP